MLNLNEKIKSKTIRVFLSSTFADMQEERTCLINTIFPALRHQAHEHGVELVEVDLRWGITETEAREGEVLRLCLNEIDLCKETSDELPFFIGLLGNRYGWQPQNDASLNKQKKQQLIEDFPEVELYLEQDLSVTEMEMSHAVLDKLKHSPHLTRQSCFYFRESTCTTMLQQINPDEEYSDREDVAGQKLMSLKAKIAEGGNEPQSYGSMEHLGEIVSSDFNDFLNAHFGELDERDEAHEDRALHFAERDQKKIIDNLAEEQRRQAQFAQTRTRLYIERPGLFSQIDQLLTANKPVVVTAGVGLGKTSLLANYIADIQQRENAPELFYHFCGGTVFSDSLEVMQRRLIAELQLFSGMTIEVPEEKKDLPQVLVTVLLATPKDKNILLVIDAIDQLDERTELNWLPMQFPDNIRLIVSLKTPVDGVPHPVLPILEKRLFEVVPILPLGKSERKAIVENIFESYGKTLEDGLLYAIIEDKKSENPMILRTLIEEVRLLGHYASLDNDIGNYLSSDSYEDFFEKVLHRIERDFEGAKEVLLHISSSRAGLTEKEISGLVNSNGSSLRFTPLQWAGLYETLRPHLKEQDGAFIWFHGIIERAASRRYLSDDAAVAVCREGQVSFFAKNRMSERSLFNLPWLYNEVGDLQGLGRYIGDSDVFMELYQTQNMSNELIAYVRNLEGNFDLYECFREHISRIDNKGERGRKFFKVAHFYSLIKEYSKVEDFYLRSLRIRRELRKEHPVHYTDTVGGVLQNLGYLYQQQGRLKESERCYSEAHEIMSALVDESPGLYAKDLCLVSTNMGNLYKSLNLHEEAEHFYKEGVRLCEEHCDGEDKTIAEIYNNLGNLSESQQNYTDAGIYFSKSLQFMREAEARHPDRYSFHLATVLANQGNFFSALQDYPSAKENFTEALAVRRKLVEQNPEIYMPSVADSLNDLGILYSDLHDFYEAKTADIEALAIRRQLAEKNPDVYMPRVAMSLNNLGLLYKDMGAYEAAKNAYAEALQIRRGLAEKEPEAYGSDVAASLNNLGVLCKDLQDYQDAKEFYTEALAIYRQLAEQAYEVYSPDIAMSLNNLGILYKGLQGYQDAKEAYTEALAIRRQLADQNPEVYEPDVARSLNNLGSLYSDLRDYQGAKEVYIEALTIRRRLAEQNPEVYTPDVAASLNNLGSLYSDLRDYQDAKEVYIEALAIWRRLADQNPEVYMPDVATTLNNLGVLHLNLENYQDAKEAYAEAMAIRRQLADQNPEVYTPDVAASLNNLGGLYINLENYQDAKEVYIEALAIRRRLADQNPEVYMPDVAAALNNLGVSYKSLEDYQDAKKVFIEAMVIRRRLADQNPEVYMPDVAASLTNLGNLYTDLRDYQDATEVYNEALAVHEKLAEKNPEVYKPNVAESFQNLGVIYKSLQNYQAAKDAFRKALAFYVSLPVEQQCQYEEKMDLLKSNAKNGGRYEWLTDINWLMVSLFFVLCFTGIFGGVFMGLRNAWLWFLSIPLFLLSLVGILLIVAAIIKLKWDSKLDEP